MGFMKGLWGGKSSAPGQVKVKGTGASGHHLQGGEASFPPPPPPVPVPQHHRWRIHCALFFF